jgi:hypothetical protein
MHQDDYYQIEKHKALLPIFEDNNNVIQKLMLEWMWRNKSEE